VITLSLTEVATFTAFKAVMSSMLPSLQVVLGQVNKVPQVRSEDFAIYWPTRRERLSTNVDESADALFVGTIVQDVMTVSSVLYGKPVLQGPVYGYDVLPNTTIIALIAVNPDGTGTYRISPSQTPTVDSGAIGFFQIGSSQIAVGEEGLAGGVTKVTQNTKLMIQLDVHGPMSADNAQIISTLLRDEYGVSLFDPDNSGVCPLFADDPKQMPYSNEQQQVENRWVIEVALQVNPTVVIPQQYADVLSIIPLSVDATFPT